MAGILDQYLQQQQPQQVGGILQFLQSPQAQGLAQGLLAASGPSPTPVSFGQALGQGMQSAEAYGDKARSRQMQELEWQMKLEDYKRKQESQEFIQKLLTGQMSGGSPTAPTGGMDAQGLPADGAMPQSGGMGGGASPQGGMPASPNDIAMYGALTGNDALTTLAKFQQDDRKFQQDVKEKDPAYIADVERQKKQAAADVDKESYKPKAQSALNGFERKTNIVLKNITEAKKLMDKPFNMATGWGTYADNIPNTDSGELKNYLETIKSNIGFDELQVMRENSPTGGALGQISDFENKLLQAVKGALDPKQKDQLISNLEIIEELYPQVLMEKKLAFKQDYGGDLEIPIPPDLQPGGGGGNVIPASEYFK